MFANGGENAPLIEGPERLQFLDGQLMDDNFIRHRDIIHRLAGAPRALQREGEAPSEPAFPPT